MEPVPFDKRSGKIWYNGKLVDWKEANLHILIKILLYVSFIDISTLLIYQYNFNYY
jgi:branched-chain amino acid aminotransferase